MIVNLTNAFLRGTLSAIPSKSYAHRIAICNFFAGENPISGCEGFTSNDISVTENCLKALKNGENTLDCGESGSTLRFLLPLCSALGGKFKFIGHGKLMQRPNEELFLVMSEHGVRAKKTDYIETEGKLSAGEYKIRGDISSQYVSGLLMALPTLDGDSKITLLTPLVSAPYVDITLEVLDKFGVKIERVKDGFLINGNQCYGGKVAPEGDWSNASFFLVGGAINGDITLTGLNLFSAQGDKYIVDILKLAGADINLTKKGVTVKKSKLKAFTYSAEDCPDLVPITAVLASYAEGKSVIKNIQRLKIKESDRVVSTIAMLNGFGIKAECVENDLIIYGGKPVCGKVDAFNDHRLAMSTAILALGAEGVSTLTDAKAINKSYPTFFEDYNRVGGKADGV